MLKKLITTIKAICRSFFVRNEKDSAMQYLLDTAIYGDNTVWVYTTNGEGGYTGVLSRDTSRSGVYILTDRRNGLMFFHYRSIEMIYFPSQETINARKLEDNEKKVIN